MVDHSVVLHGWSSVISSDGDDERWQFVERPISA
jgi:hypothetical protein